MSLYLVPTPIGNLGDMTARSIEVLESVDYVACEDTRVSGSLLSKFQIKKSLIKHHKHNEKTSSAHILNLLNSGKTVAYISDAGMPGISDPGKELVNMAIENGIKYTVLAGASALTTAYSASMFSSSEFYFAGFLQIKGRKDKLSELSTLKVPIVFYEAPHRVKPFLEDLLEVFGDRKVSVLREISKLYESYLHSTLVQIVEHSEIVNPKGEFVVVVDGAKEVSTMMSRAEIEKLAQNRLSQGEKKSVLAKDLAKLTNELTRNDIYKLIAEIDVDS